MTTFVFPGQGSQSKGMGAELFSEFPNEVQKANQILGYSIENLCLQDPDQVLNRTDHTQPALYVVSALSYLKKIKEGVRLPDFTAGHSLGEYNALFAAGVFDFTTGLKLVQKRGELMARATGGGMAAVIGLSGDVVQNILQENNIAEVTIANYNSHKQIVITGPKDIINKIDTLFTAAGATLYMPLKVSGAFHSPLMRAAQQEFAHFIQQFSFTTPKITVIANVNAKPFQLNEMQTNLINQITHSVQWVQSIEFLLAEGETEFEEIGPGKVLTGLIAKIRKGE